MPGRNALAIQIATHSRLRPPLRRPPGASRHPQQISYRG